VFFLRLYAPHLRRRSSHMRRNLQMWSWGDAVGGARRLFATQVSLHDPYKLRHMADRPGYADPESRLQAIRLPA
jgi:hypothetical protein